MTTSKAIGIALATALAIGGAAALAQARGDAAGGGMAAAKVVDASGNLRVPAYYRETYQALGSWAIAADGGAGSKEMHEVYASPGAMAAYRKTGRSPRWHSPGEGGLRRHNGQHDDWHCQPSGHAQRQAAQDHLDKLQDRLPGLPCASEVDGLDLRQRLSGAATRRLTRGGPAIHWKPPCDGQGYRASVDGARVVRLLELIEPIAGDAFKTAMVQTQPEPGATSAPTSKEFPTFAEARDWLERGSALARRWILVVKPPRERPKSPILWLPPSPAASSWQCTSALAGRGVFIQPTCCNRPPGGIGRGVAQGPAQKCRGMVGHVADRRDFRLRRLHGQGRIELRSQGRSPGLRSLSHATPVGRRAAQQQIALAILR